MIMDWTPTQFWAVVAGMVLLTGIISLTDWRRSRRRRRRDQAYQARVEYIRRCLADGTPLWQAEDSLDAEENR